MFSLFLADGAVLDFVAPRTNDTIDFKANIRNGEHKKALQMIRKKSILNQVDELNINEHMPEIGGLAPLHLASGAGSLELVIALISAGAIIDHPSSETHDTALHFACSNDQRGIAEMLVIAGADPFRKNRDGKSCLGTCRSRGFAVNLEQLKMKLLNNSDNSNNTKHILHDRSGLQEKKEEKNELSDLNSNVFLSSPFSNQSNSIVTSNNMKTSGVPSVGISIENASSVVHMEDMVLSAARTLATGGQHVLISDTAKTAMYNLFENIGQFAKAQRNKNEKGLKKLRNRLRDLLRSNSDLINCRYCLGGTALDVQQGVSPLHYAAQLGCDEIIEILLALNTPDNDVETGNNNGESKTKNKIENEYKKSDQLNEVEKSIGANLTPAFTSPNEQDIKANRRRVSAWDRDIRGRTALHFAAEMGHGSTCALLRSRMRAETNNQCDPVGADAPLDLSGSTPLGAAACRSGRRPADEVVQALYSPGDQSILPRASTLGRAGVSPLKRGNEGDAHLNASFNDKNTPSVSSDNPISSTKDVEATAEIATTTTPLSQCLAYGLSEANGWRKSMEDRMIVACPLLAETETESKIFMDEVQGSQPEMEFAFFAVLDGHGGQEASQSLRDIFPDILRKELLTQMQTLKHVQKSNASESEIIFAKCLHESCLDADRQLSRMPQLAIQQSLGAKNSVTPQRSLKARSYAGSTFTSLLVTAEPSLLLCANVGDSRCVLARSTSNTNNNHDNNNPTTLGPLQPIALSIDHKFDLSAERERAERAGAHLRTIEYSTTNNATKEEVQSSIIEVWVEDANPDVSQRALRMSRAFGDFHLKQNVALPPEAQAVVAVPDIKVEQFTDSDIFAVLACDGVWDVMSNQEVLDFIAPMITSLAKTAGGTGAAIQHACAKACDSLIEECLKRGSTDNMSVIVVVLAPHMLGGDPQKLQSEKENGQSNAVHISTGASNLPNLYSYSYASPVRHSGGGQKVAVTPSSRDLGIAPSELSTGPEKSRVDFDVDIKNTGEESPVKAVKLFSGWTGFMG